MRPKECLIVVDPQNDFILSDGALSVPLAEDIIPFIKGYLDDYHKGDTPFDLVVVTQDWHPANHKSFASNHEEKKVFDVVDLNGIQQVLWPDHCVQGTPGAEFHKDLNFDGVKVIQKGMDPEVDSYSGFYDNNRKHSTGLTDYLKQQEVKTVYVCGFATDYCVKFTAIDAVKEGFKTFLLQDLCQGVEMNKGDIAKACEEMEKEGVILSTTEYL